MSVQNDTTDLRKQLEGGLKLAERAVLAAGRETIRQLARMPSRFEARQKITTLLGLVARDDACALQPSPAHWC
jgi:hypothetical protein